MYVCRSLLNKTCQKALESGRGHLHKGESEIQLPPHDAPHPVLGHLRPRFRYVCMLAGSFVLSIVLEECTPDAGYSQPKCQNEETYCGTPAVCGFFVCLWGAKAGGWGRITITIYVVAGTNRKGSDCLNGDGCLSWSLEDICCTASETCFQNIPLGSQGCSETHSNNCTFRCETKRSSLSCKSGEQSCGMNVIGGRGGGGGGGGCRSVSCFRCGRCCLDVEQTAASKPL